MVIPPHVEGFEGEEEAEVWRLLVMAGGVLGPEELRLLGVAGMTKGRKGMEEVAQALGVLRRYVAHPPLSSLEASVEMVN